VVPPSPGILSAYGLIAADYVLFETMTRRALADATAGDVLRAVYSGMRRRALERAEASGLEGPLVLSLTADMRFVGQAFEVPVTFEAGELEALTASDVRQRFAEAHQRVYFFGGEAVRPVEFVSFRLRVLAPLETLPLLTQATAERRLPRQIRIFDRKAWQDAQLLPHGALARGEVLSGPALLEDPTSTLYVPSAWTARIDANDNTVLERC
jgi:N-methylhydantoinase A